MHEALVNGLIFKGPSDPSGPDDPPYGVDREEYRKLKKEQERHDLGDHLASIMALLETPLPLWMVQAFRDGQARSENAEQ